MISPQRTTENELSVEIIREINYDIPALQQQVAEFVPSLLPEQKRVFDEVLGQIESGNGALFFLDAPGGTGKTFSLNLEQLRKTVLLSWSAVCSMFACVKCPESPHSFPEWKNI